MVERTEVEEAAKPQRQREEVCTASVRLSVALSVATIGAVAVVVALVLLLT